MEVFFFPYTSLNIVETVFQTPLWMGKCSAVSVFDVNFGVQFDRSLINALLPVNELEYSIL